MALTDFVISTLSVIVLGGVFMPSRARSAGRTGAAQPDAGAMA